MYAFVYDKTLIACHVSYDLSWYNLLSIALDWSRSKAIYNKP